MHRAIMLSLFFIIVQVFCASLDDAYKDGLSVAQANMQKPVNIINNLKPAETFKDKNAKSDYTENPPQTNLYQDGKIENASDVWLDEKEDSKAAKTAWEGDKVKLENAGRAGIDKNEAIKAVWASFGKEKVKIDPSDPWMSKSNDIIRNSADIVIGASSKPNEVVKNGASAGVNCKEEKVCRIDLVKKKCNEEKDKLKKICEKVPEIEVVDEGSFAYSGEIQPVDDPHIGTFTLPATGTITSFSANFGSWHVQYGLWACDYRGGQYPGYLQNVYISKSRSRDCDEFVETMSYSNGNLNIPVEAGKSITFRFDGYVRDRCGKYGCDWRAWREGRINKHWSSSHYDLVIRRKAAKVKSWLEINCSEK